MKRKEYLFGELPEELCIPEVQAMACPLGAERSAMVTLGFIWNGVRYRVYRDAQARASHKSYCDLRDALLGAEVSVNDIAIAMGTLGLDVGAQSEIWAELADATREEYPVNEEPA
jgi:hypothetical protein